MLSTQDLGDGITCIDTGYIRPRMTACYLMEQAGRVAFIETGVNRNVSGLLDVLEQKGIAREQVDYVIPTHVHLNHAGGVGALMKALPNAQLVIHPRGARHMINPSKLIAGASAIYGEEKFIEMYGELTPVDEQRVIKAADNFVLNLGDRPLLFLHTPGHARHHFCIFDEQSQSVFTGDTLGLSYREFDSAGKVFCLPTTSPVQFEPQALHESIDRIMSFNPTRTYLTHFGCISTLQDSADQLHRSIDVFVSIAEKFQSADNRVEMISKAMCDFLLQQAHSINPAIQPDIVQQILEVDIDLNTQGLDIWLNRQ